MSVSIRRIIPQDRAGWDPLWSAYCRFYRAEVDAEITDRTFARLCEGADLVGLVALDEDGRPIGFANALFHASTWSLRGYCYLEDVFVAPEQRGGRVARALIEAVYAQADARGAERVYWHTQEFNAPARSLYDTLARRTSFIVYRR
ncbi:MAG TPA: GNAT family N-acetyltransferase [Tahibacter sp.]|uniref:GNAT family N-acetyltransferase n=1 Tax=Tahibacter sp. TaxID=2056211 RepID=UPI002CB79AC5|nr:GNAT family N-acetyltransferase [Tahibacter sp.]HSX61508.1 GNAT family N-acetyltransferase [Tahibacter sp.]